jgi:CubicO group peptidase (beta-lactamase class C family)
MALDLECRMTAMRAWKRSIRTVGAVAASAGVLAIVLGLLVLAVRPTGGQAAGGVSAEGGPRFRVDGPDADSFGRGEGYPVCKGLEYAQRQRCRIGAFSHFDQLFPSRTIKAPAAPTRLGRAPVEPAISYTYNGQRQTIDQYLDKHPVTGFLIAKGDSILVERYQYGRTDTQRLTSFSMAKTVVALLIGIAVGEGAIRSIDERAEVYVPELKGTEYGRTPIKALLQMSSGVAFREDYTDMTSDIAKLAVATLGQEAGGGLAAVTRFNIRNAEPGQRFSYASSESMVLGLVLARATRRSVSDYASEKLWQPLGAEADATWCIDATGQEITYAYFNAVLRDWGRIGLMLANDGRWAGKTIVPRAWVLESTTPRVGLSRPPGDGSAPKRSFSRRTTSDSPSLLYGYHVWLLSGPGRQFSLRGLRGQFVFVDPGSKLVLVQTAARGGVGFQDEELFALWAALRSQ